MMNYANLFWLFGHPEVYILILPAFGVYSEVVSAFSSKELYGYTSLVLATMAIAVLSFTVWVHHFFTMGQSANVNAVFGIATMTIGVPTGVKIYDWIWTMFRGEVRFTAAHAVSRMAFMMTFVLGGFSGIILATPPLDYHGAQHPVPGGALPQHAHPGPAVRDDRRLPCSGSPRRSASGSNERWGRIAFGCWMAGFYLAFFPLYVLGAAGMARRTQEVFEPGVPAVALSSHCSARFDAVLRGLPCLCSCSSTSASATGRRTACSRSAIPGTPAGWSGRYPRRRRRNGTLPRSRTWVDRVDHVLHGASETGGAYLPAGSLPRILSCPART